MDIKRLMQMRDSLASLGAHQGVSEQVEQDEVHIEYRNIILREIYQWPSSDVFRDVTIQVYQNESLFDELRQLKPFNHWIRLTCKNPSLQCSKLVRGGKLASVQETIKAVEEWKQELFSRDQEGDPPVLSFGRC